MQRKTMRISLVFLMFVQFLFGAYNLGTAHAVSSGDSLEWGLPLASGVGPTYSVPTGVHPDVSLTHLSLNGDAVLALHSDNSATAWGNDDQSQLGDGQTGQPLNEVNMLLPSVVQVSAGGNGWGAALTADGSVYTFGRNAEAELGNRPPGAVPGIVPNLPQIKQIATGTLHAIALAADGSVWAWGGNARGQMGDPNNTSTYSFVPAKVLGLPAVVKIFTKFDTNFALDSSGNVWAWGDNGQQQFGGPTADGLHHGFNAVPVKITGIPAMKQIAPARLSVIGLSTSGQVWSWGSNPHGQLGDGSSLDAWHTPVAVPGLNNVASIGSGQEDSFAVMNDGSLKGWGWNFAGELGLGNSAEQNTPVFIPGVSNAAGVDSNGTHTVVWNALLPSPATFSGASVKVTPTTPMYQMDYSASISSVVCPATVTTVINAGTTKVASLCATGGTAPAQFNWGFNVRNLDPNSGYTLTATISDANGLSVPLATNFVTPYAPIWIAAGDSVSSGHHQDKDEPCSYSSYTTARLAGLLANGNTDGTCLAASGASSLKANDESFSWPSRSVQLLNSRFGMPDKWKLQLIEIAKSGASTQDFHLPSASNCPGCGQQALAVSAAETYAGGWNILSATGGADDIKFAKALQTFYANQSPASFNLNAKPWTVTTRVACPDSDTLKTNVQSLVTSGLIENQRVNGLALKNFFSAVMSMDRNIRAFVISYPHVLNSSDTCAGDSATISPHSGANTVVDALDDGYISPLSALGIRVIDLRSPGNFSSLPRDEIQLTRYYGYPHPNSTGQDSIDATVSSNIH